MSCKYCDKPADYAVHSGLKIPPVMTCYKHILKGISAVFLAQDTYQVTVQDMNKYRLWKNRKFTEHYGKPKNTSYYINLVDTWLSGFKSIQDAKPVVVTLRYARRVPLTMIIKAKDWNNLKLAILERPEIYKIDEAHLAGGATITHYINRHRAWYLDVWDVAKKIKLVFGPLHLDAYQGNCRIEPAPLGFEEDIKLENPTTGEVSFPGLSLFNPVTPGFGKNLGKFLLSQLNPYKHGAINPDFEDAVQTLLEESLNTPVANKAEKPHYLCQSDFCFKCGDRVTNTGSSFGYNQRVVCLKCFRKAENTAGKDDSKELKCAGCGNKNVSHATGTEAYCHECWEALACKVCNNCIGDSGTSYNGIIYCKSCYGKLTESKPYCSECKGPLDLNAVTINGHPVCKTCYDRFYNPEINYRCKGCGAIIPDKGKICNKCGPECVHCKTHQGPFKTIDHKLYCHGCADLCKQPKECPECGLPLGNHPVAIPDSHSVCRSCYNNEPKCVDCGASNVELLDKDESGLKVCQKCFDALPKCPICGKPNNAQGVCDCYCARKDDSTSNG